MGDHLPVSPQALLGHTGAFQEPSLRYSHRSSGSPCRCNISYLEEWLKDKNLQNSLAKETLEALSQAAWLLQVKKATDSDAKEISERCTSLSAVQVLTHASRAQGPQRA